MKNNKIVKSSLETKALRELNAIFIIMLCLMITGAFIYQFMFKEAPCPLCLLQRLGMIAVMMGGLFNLKFGIRIQHYVMSIFGALVGASISIRQILLHIAPGSQPFGKTIDGLALYTWAFITFVVAIFGCSILLYLFKPEQSTKPVTLTLLDKFTIIYMGLVIFSNFIYTALHCGFGVCTG